MLVWGVAVQSVPETWDSRHNSRGSSACCHSRLAASKTAQGRRRGSEDQHTCLHGMIKHRHGSSSRPPTPRPFLRPSPLESAKRLIITSSEHRVFTSLCCDTVDASTPTLLDLHETSGNNSGPTLIGKGGKTWNALHSLGHCPVPLDAYAKPAAASASVRTRVSNSCDLEVGHPESEGCA